MSLTVYSEGQQSTQVFRSCQVSGQRTGQACRDALFKPGFAIAVTQFVTLEDAPLFFSIGVHSKNIAGVHHFLIYFPGISKLPGLQLALLLFGCEIVLQYSLAGFPLLSFQIAFTC